MVLFCSEGFFSYQVSRCFSDFPLFVRLGCAGDCAWCRVSSVVLTGSVSEHHEVNKHIEQMSSCVSGLLVRAALVHLLFDGVLLRAFCGCFGRDSLWQHSSVGRPVFIL